MKSVLVTGIVIGQYYLSQKGRTDQKGRRKDGWMDGRMERLIKEPAEFNTGGVLLVKEEGGQPHV